MSDNCDMLNALKDKSLLKKGVTFKMKFYRDSWAKYEECLTNNLRLVPSEFRLKELEKDYEEMKEMFYGEVPKFNEIIEQLKIVEKLINA